MFTYDCGHVKLNGMTWEVIPDPSVEQIIIKNADELFQFGKEAFDDLTKRFSSDLLSLQWLFNTYFWGNKELDRMFDESSDTSGAGLTGHIRSSNKKTALAQLIVEKSLNPHAVHQYAEMFENLDIRVVS